MPRSLVFEIGNRVQAAAPGARSPVLSVDAPPRSHAREKPIEIAARIAVAHQADPRERPGVAMDRHRPGESFWRHVAAEITDEEGNINAGRIDLPCVVL